MAGLIKEGQAGLLPGEINKLQENARSGDGNDAQHNLLSMIRREKSTRNIMNFLLTDVSEFSVEIAQI